MKGGDLNSEPLIIVNSQEIYEKEFLIELNQRRIELISSIVYRVLSNKE